MTNRFKDISMKLTVNKVSLFRWMSIVRRPLLALVVLAAVGTPLTSAEPQSSSQMTISSPETVGPAMNVVGSTIELSLGDRNSSVRFEIYSITGQLVKSVTVTSAPVKIELPKGFYIVKCDSWTRRVMLK